MRAHEPCSAWAGRGLALRRGIVEAVPTPPPAQPAHAAAAPPGGVTRPPPNPKTGRPFRPGERLERQAWGLVARSAPIDIPPPRRGRGRNYDDLVDRALARFDGLEI